MISRATALLPKDATFGTLTWLIAASTMLTMLAVAAAMGLAGVGSAIGQASAESAIVQIIDADPARHDADTARTLRLLGQLADIRAARAIGRQEIDRLLAPYLGDMRADDLPMPGMIALTLRPDADRGRIAQALAAIPTARLDTATQTTAPLALLIASLRTAAILGAAIAVTATILVALLAARAALAAHEAVIAILHSLGATDPQLSRMMARRSLSETIGGALIGFAAGGAAILLLSRPLRAIGAGLGDAALLGWPQWLMLLLVPPLIALIATGTVRLTTLAMLRGSP